MEEIVKGCIKHDQKACRQFYDTFAPQMLGVCMRYTGSREEAQDVMHDGMIKAYESLRTLQNVDSLAGWLRRIMVNTAINYLQRQREQWERLEEISSQDVSLCYEAYDVEYLLRAIQQLPDRYRVVFNLKEVEGYSYEEISSQLNVGQSTLRSWLNRGRKMLQEILEKDDR